MTETEKDVLRALENRIDTIAYVVRELAAKTFTPADRENTEGLEQALADCHHELRVVQRLDPDRP